MPPAEYDTIFTSMLQLKRLPTASGQPFTVFTSDQQLYRYALEMIVCSINDVENLVRIVGYFGRNCLALSLYRLQTFYLNEI